MRSRVAIALTSAGKPSNVKSARKAEKHSATVWLFIPVSTIATFP